ncbi:MAG: hypothetical protein LBL00_03935, partial [Endomicrobium sp.]|nr:hypothetical protein [Endomicrobium sp.]
MIRKRLVKIVSMAVLMSFIMNIALPSFVFARQNGGREDKNLNKQLQDNVSVGMISVKDSFGLYGFKKDKDNVIFKNGDRWGIWNEEKEVAYQLTPDGFKVNKTVTEIIKKGGTKKEKTDKGVKGSSREKRDDTEDKEAHEISGKIGEEENEKDESADVILPSEEKSEETRIKSEEKESRGSAAKSGEEKNEKDKSADVVILPSEEKAKETHVESEEKDPGTSALKSGEEKNKKDEGSNVILSSEEKSEETPVKTGNEAVGKRDDGQMLGNMRSGTVESVGSAKNTGIKIFAQTQRETESGMSARLIMPPADKAIENAIYDNKGISNSIEADIKDISAAYSELIDAKEIESKNKGIELGENAYIKTDMLLERQEKENEGETAEIEDTENIFEAVPAVMEKAVKKAITEIISISDIIRSMARYTYAVPVKAVNKEKRNNEGEYGGDEEKTEEVLVSAANEAAMEKANEEGNKSGAIIRTDSQTSGINTHAKSVNALSEAELLAKTKGMLLKVSNRSRSGWFSKLTAVKMLSRKDREAIESAESITAVKAAASKVKSSIVKEITIAFIEKAQKGEEEAELQSYKYDEEIVSNLVQQTGLSKKEVIGLLSQAEETAKKIDEQKGLEPGTTFNLSMSDLKEFLYQGGSILNCAADALFNQIGNTVSKGLLALQALSIEIGNGNFSKESGIKDGQIMTSMNAMNEVLRLYGQTSAGYGISAEDFIEGLQSGESAILWVEQNHFITVSKNRDNTLNVIDINRNNGSPQTYSAEEFKKLVNGGEAYTITGESLKGYNGADIGGQIRVLTNGQIIEKESAVQNILTAQEMSDIRGSDFWSDVGNAFSNGISAIGDAISDGVNAIGDAIRDGVSSVGDALSDAGEWVKAEVFRPVEDWYKDFGETWAGKFIGGFFDNLWLPVIPGLVSVGWKDGGLGIRIGPHIGAGDQFIGVAWGSNTKTGSTFEGGLIIGNDRLFGASVMYSHDDYYGDRYKLQGGISFYGVVGVTAGVSYWERDPDGLFRDGWSVNTAVTFAGGAVQISTEYNFRYEEIKNGVSFGYGDVRIRLEVSYSAVRQEWGFGINIGPKSGSGGMSIGFNYKTGLAGTYNSETGRWEFDPNSKTTSFGFNIGRYDADGNGASIGFTHSETEWRWEDGTIKARSTSDGFNVNIAYGGDAENKKAATPAGFGFMSGTYTLYDKDGNYYASSTTTGISLEYGDFAFNISIRSDLTDRNGNVLSRGDTEMTGKINPDI